MFPIYLQLPNTHSLENKLGLGDRITSLLVCVQLLKGEGRKSWLVIGQKWLDHVTDHVTAEPTCACAVEVSAAQVQGRADAAETTNQVVAKVPLVT